jgi:uncharacterized membrane protein YeaQ/YmgE (transglycosylase-associated protein family)
MDMGGGVGIFGTLLIGGLAGWIAEKLTRSDHGLLTNIVVGILGSFVGSVVANAIGLRMDEIFQGWFWGNLILSVAGAVLLIAVYRAFRRKS